MGIQYFNRGGCPSIMTPSKMGKTKQKKNLIIYSLSLDPSEPSEIVVSRASPRMSQTMLQRMHAWNACMPHHHSTNSYEPIRFLQTSQNRLINIHRNSLKHISQSALFGFSKNIGHDQIRYENSVVFKAVQ